MYNSILHFNEFGVKKIEKVIKNFLENKDRDLGDLVMDLTEPLQELQREIIRETIEEIDEIYRQNQERKKNYYIERREEENSILTTCGEVSYRRTYFKSKETKKYEYLADKAFGITDHMRKSEDVSIKLIENAVDMSYRLSGEKATATDDVVSKQAVMKEIHELDIPKIIPEPKEKRKKKVIYINADEDHVSLQFHNKKGDLKENENGYKNNTVMPKLIYIFDGIKKEGPKNKRNQLINKHCFGTVTSNNEKLWEEVMEYIDTVYDEEYIEKIYIMGDGASWIRKGVDILGAKCRFVLDKFHFKQYITKATSHLGEKAEYVRTCIGDEISFEDREGIKRIFRLIIENTESESKKGQVRKTRDYVLNQWEAIIIRNDDPDARMGCSAEGNVSHIYSSRLSSRPLGWSRIGVKKMSELRIYCQNGGKVYDLVKYQKMKQEREIKEEIQKEMDRKIKRKRENYTEVWNSSNIATDMGKRTGVYHIIKSIKGIC
jgi:hypothetical protein